MERRPDVVEVLDLDNRLDPTGSESDSPPRNRCFGQRRVVYALGAKIALQPGGQFEYASLPLDQLFREVLFSAAVGNVFAKHYDATVALHLVAKTSVDQIRHGLVSAVPAGFGRKGRRGWIQIGGVDEPGDGVRLRKTGGQRSIRSALNFVIDLLLQAVDLFFVKDVFPDEEQLHARDRIALGIPRTL